MELKAMKCPTCGADLQVPDDKDYMVCPYCSTTVQVREEIKLKYDANTDNLLKLADEDLKTGNYQEAYDYYNKVLEGDAKNPDGWLGKAVSSGFMSNNVNEMMEWIGVAVANSSGDKQNSIKLKAASYINTIIIGYDSTIDKTSNLMSFLNFNVGSEDIYNSVINAMETAHSYSPLNKEILHNLIRVLIHAKKFILNTEIDSKIQKYQFELKTLDSTYNPDSDIVKPPVTINAPTYTSTSQTPKKSGCAGKFVGFTIVMIALTVLGIGIAVYFVMHAVTTTVDNTKENITKQLEPLKDLKNIQQNAKKYEVVNEYNKGLYHVMNVYAGNTDMDGIIKLNSTLRDTYKSKYEELIINYFYDNKEARKYSGVITNPGDYTIPKREEGDPDAIMVFSKSNGENAMYKKMFDRYVSTE